MFFACKFYLGKREFSQMLWKSKRIEVKWPDEKGTFFPLNVKKKSMSYIKFNKAHKYLKAYREGLELSNKLKYTLRRIQIKCLEILLSQESETWKIYNLRKNLIKHKVKNIKIKLYFI